MNKRAFYNMILCGLFSLFTPFFVNAQGEIAFTNKVTYTKTGSIIGVRLVSLMPAPVTNEYQEINELSSNCGNFIDVNVANKVLFYDGSFSNNSFDVAESFKYKSRPIQIDFNKPGNKNEVTGIDPNEYLGSDGTYIDLSNTTIKNIGDQLWAQSANKLDYAKRCYEYVASHYSYINGSWRTLAEIISIGGGECGDFTTLFVNLMRHKGIPARHNIGVWADGGYHVWPDFYHEDYGWIPVDPTFKNSNPYADYFGRYDGNLIILSQGLTSFTSSGIEIQNVPLQTFFYWFWYQSGTGTISGKHKTSKDYQVDGVNPVRIYDDKTGTIYNLNGMKQTYLERGINIVNGKKIIVK
jgi:hypothetical protein